MPGKRACLIVNLRTGRNVVRVPEMVAVLSAAGWKTDICLKAYRGETLPLAKRAAKDGYDLVIGYGGDGTLNAVVNGVLYGGGKSIIGDLPGGSFNEWAGETAIPCDPVQAALALVESVTCRVDLGFFQVEGLAVPARAVRGGHREHWRGEGNEEEEQVEQTEATAEIRAKPKKAGKHRHYFLLHAGLGVDAAILAHINKPLKYTAGKLAFDVAGLKALPRQRPFPVEIASLHPSGRGDLLWQGEAWQIVVNNTRRYGGTIELSPQAAIDDGVLDVTVIPAGGPLTTLQEAVSLLLLHTVDTAVTRSFRGAHLSISVPASIEIELDGSVVTLTDSLRNQERRALERAGDADGVMVHYRFDAVPAAVRIAFPSTYDGSMFARPAHKRPFERAAQQRRQREEQLAARQQEHRSDGGARQECSTALEELQRHGREITVVGVAPHPHRRQTYIIAGTYQAKKDGKIEPAAIRVDERTRVLNRQGEQVIPQMVEKLHEGEQMCVEGRKRKRGVIDAVCVLLEERTDL